MGFLESEARWASHECPLTLEDVLDLHLLPLRTSTCVGLTSDSGGYSKYVITPAHDSMGDDGHMFKVELQYQSQCGWRDDGTGYGQPWTATVIMCRSRVEVALTLMFDERDEMDWGGLWSTTWMGKQTPHLFAALMKASEIVNLVRSKAPNPTALHHAAQAVFNAMTLEDGCVHPDPDCFMSVEQVRRARAIQAANTGIEQMYFEGRFLTNKLPLYPDLVVLLIKLAPRVLKPMVFKL